MSVADDFVQKLQSVQWPVYGFSQNPFHLTRAGGEGWAEREGKVVSIDLIYKGQTPEQTTITVDITTLDAHDRMNMLGARRSLEPLPNPRFTAVCQSLDPSGQSNSQIIQEINLSDDRCYPDYRLFRKYQLTENLTKPLGTPQVIPLTFSTLGKDFDGQLRVWPSFSLSRFLLFQEEVIVSGDIRGLQDAEQLCALLKMIVPINKPEIDV